MSKVPKFFVTDIDGVWTDGYVTIDENGIERKRFSIGDGWGARHLNELSIPWAVLTSDVSQIPRMRAQKLGCPHILIGIQDKKLALSELLTELDIEAKDVAYLGDDFNDLPVLELGVQFYCPASAHPLVQKHAHAILKSNSGEGCFRELVEHFVLNPESFPHYFQPNKP